MAVNAVHHDLTFYFLTANHRLLGVGDCPSVAQVVDPSAVDGRPRSVDRDSGVGDNGHDGANCVGKKQDRNKDTKRKKKDQSCFTKKS